MNARELYTAGRLREAIEASNAEVKAKPADIDARGFLAELLSLDGNLERADVQLQTIGNQSPELAPMLALHRQLIRAETSRQEFYREGHVPEFLGQPSEHLQLYLQASIAAREGDPGSAGDLLVRAEEERPRVAGTLDGAPFADLRDLDDLGAAVFEVLTSTGKFYWIPVDRVRSVEFKAPGRPIDLLWRPAEMVVEDGPDGTVFLPTIYAPLTDEVDEQMRIGRATDWTGEEGVLMRGRGLRTYLVGEEAKTILELGELEFAAHGA